LTIWFIEANTTPLIEADTDHRRAILVKMLSDHLDVVYGLLKSRLKRIVQYVNKVVKETPLENIKGDQVKVKDLDLKQAEFLKLTQNHFEPEFAPSASNSWYKIIDESVEGPERFGGLLPAECYDYWEINEIVHNSSRSNEYYLFIW